MSKPKIAVFSGQTATISNSPTLVTGNKGRLSGERPLPGRFEHLIAQELYEPVVVKIKKFSGHPLEIDAKEVYHDNGKDYWEVELHPNDGPYLLPYVARRANDSTHGTPFEESDLLNSDINYGGRQFFYPDAKRIFIDIDRTISGRDHNGEANILNNQADFEFIRVLPPGGYTKQGEVHGKDFFGYKPFPLRKLAPPGSLAKVINMVQSAFDNGTFTGGIWLEGTPSLEETLYWLNLLLDSDIPLAGVSSQRPHGQISNDGDHNIIDAVGYVLSGQGSDLGVVAVLDERIFASRELKKGDDRPGGYKATGGHGGVLGSPGPPITIWYKPAFRHTKRSDVNLSNLPKVLEFTDITTEQEQIRIPIKDDNGFLLEESIPRVDIVKFGHYWSNDSIEGWDAISDANADCEVGILARIRQGLEEQSNNNTTSPKLHGFVLEGANPYGFGSGTQMAALAIAACSGMPVVIVGRSDLEGPTPPYWHELTILGSNLDSNKARILLMATLLKLGRLPKARNPRNPTAIEKQAIESRIQEFQKIFDTH